MVNPLSPPHTIGPVMRHYPYFIHEGDVNIRVENYMFRVHRHFLTRESAHFRMLLEPSPDPQGISESNPIVLESPDISSEAFACLLWVFYNPKYSIYDATPDQWASILHLAKKWGFNEVEQLCVRELERSDISPVNRIHIYQRFGLEPLLIDSYATLTKREEPIEYEEGLKLGLKTSLQIAKAREESRGPDTGVGPRSPSTVQLDDSELHDLLTGIFGLPKIFTNGGAHAGPMTAPVQRSDQVDRASALAATAPTTPSKPEALSQSSSTSEAHPPTTDSVNVKVPPLKPEDSFKWTARARKQSNKS